MGFVFNSKGGRKKAISLIVVVGLKVKIGEAI